MSSQSSHWFLTKLKKIGRYNFRVKLVIGFIYKDEAIFIKAKQNLRKKFGRIDFESEALAFDCTDHYAAEIGQALKKRFISFSELIPRESLYRIKLYTHRLETKFSVARARQINIDPGYLDLAKLVLATTKDYAHRIFLRKGIFAEITLSFKGDSFVPNEWTYPDYRSQQYIAIFNQIRRLYLP